MDLVADMVELAWQYGRYGYRRIAALLRDAGWQISDGRVERLWRREGLKVPAKQPKTLRHAAEAGHIEGVHPPPDGPWIFSRSKLVQTEARQLVHRARRNAKYPAGSHPISKIYSHQQHRQMGVMKQDCSTCAKPPTFRARRQWVMTKAQLAIIFEGRFRLA